MIYEGAIRQLTSELDAVRTERDRLVGEVRRLSGINDALEQQVGQLGGVRGELERLQEVNARLAAELGVLPGRAVARLTRRPLLTGSGTLSRAQALRECA